MTGGGKALPRFEFRELRLEEFRDDLKACLRAHPRFAACSTFVVGLQNKDLADAVPEILNSFNQGKRKLEVNYVTVTANDPLPAVRAMISFAREKMRLGAPKYPRPNGGFAWTPVGGLESKEDEWLDDVVQNQNFTFDCEPVDPEGELLSARNNLGLPPRAVDHEIFHRVELWGEEFPILQRTEISREEWTHLTVPLKLAGPRIDIDVKSVLGANARMRVGHNPDTGAKVSVHLSSYLHYISSRHSRLDRFPMYIADDEVLLKNPKAFAAFIRCPTNFPPEWIPRADNPSVIPPWLLIGPSGSGTDFHVEPNNQCVFVHCLSGSKTWLVFPPDTFSNGDRLLNKHPSELTREELPGGGTWPSKIVQEAGETIVLPPNWWHTVINRQETVAVAVNFLN